MPVIAARPHRDRRVRRAALLLAACLPASTACMAEGSPMDASAFLVKDVTGVHQIAAVTGPDSRNHTDRFGVAGTDLGSMFVADGKTWFVFGDTFGYREPGFTGGGGEQWRSNTLAYSTDTDPADGITLDGYIVDAQGDAKELLPAEKVDYSEMTVIPTYGFAAGDAMYLAYMSVRHWGDPGEWETNHSGLAKSADGGQNWTVLDAPRWGGDSNFVQVSVARQGDDLYFWGVTHGRFGGVQLMRVPAAQVEEPQAYRYFTGTDADGMPTWSVDIQAAATVVEDTVGELSVVWNDELARWLMTYSNGGDAGTTLREGLAPWGPWGSPHTIAAQDDIPGLYAPYLMPGSSGTTLYFTLSIWNPYNVFWYKADLVTTG